MDIDMSECILSSQRYVSYFADFQVKYGEIINNGSDKRRRVLAREATPAIGW